MLIAIAAASAALTTLPQEPAALHPAGSTLVLQVPDIQGLMSAFQTTGLAKMLQDPDLHESIGQVMAGESGPPVDPVAMALGAYRGQVESGAMPPVLDYLESLKSMSFSLEVTGGDVLAFIAGMETSQDEDLYAAQNVGMRMVVDFVDEPSAEAVVNLLVEAIGSEGPNGMTLSARAMTAPEGAMGFGSSALRVWGFVPSEAGNGANVDTFDATLKMLAGGTRLAFTAGNVDAASYVNILAAGGQPGSALSLFSAGREAFAQASAAPVAEFFMRPFLEDMVLKEEPKVLPLLDIAEALMGPAGSMLIRGGHWRIGIDGGQFITEGMHDPGQEGPFSGVIGAQPLDRSGLALAHPDALITSVTSLNSGVLAEVIAALAAEEDENMLSGMEEQFGFRPDRDLAAPLGNAISYSLPPLTSLLSAPNLMGAVKLNDKAAFTRGMDGLMGMAEGLGDQFTLVRDEYKGAMMYTLSFTGEGLNLPVQGLPMDPASFFKPTVTIMEDRVLMTTLSTHAKKEVRRVLKLAKKGETPPVHESLMAMGDLGDATTVGYADWPTFLGAFYSQIKNLAPLLAGAMGELPFDPTMLPEAAVMTRHFKASENWTRVKGGKVMQYAKSSLGGEFLTMPLGITMGLGAATVQRSQVRAIEQLEVEEEMSVDAEMIPPPQPPGTPIERGLAQANLDLAEATRQQIDVAITIYQLDHQGKTPASLAELTKKAANAPSGYLDGGVVPKDPWGNDYVYTAADGGYSLYSVGPNGKDDGGAGDDIGQR